MEVFTISARKNEQNLLNQLCSRDDPDFLAVYGRRRVGKTYLIRNYFKGKSCLYFEVTGLKDGSLRDQLQLFTDKLREIFHVERKVPGNWLKAFQILTECIEKLSKKQTVILFFDELPWLATQKSGFVQALDHYWNTRWSLRKKLKLVACGSAASWMLENLIRAKGGLHNRLTAVMALRPFTLHETEEYLQSRHVRLSRRQILDLYMAVGGIPHYLNDVKKDLSPAQNINRMCFNKDGILFNEFNNLFASLFDQSPAYIELIRLIARSRDGIDKEELLKKAKYSSTGGTLKERLNETRRSWFHNWLCSLWAY